MTKQQRQNQKRTRQAVVKRGENHFGNDVHAFARPQRLLKDRAVHAAQDNHDDEENRQARDHDVGQLCAVAFLFERLVAAVGILDEI